MWEDGWYVWISCGQKYHIGVTVDKDVLVDRKQCRVVVDGGTEEGERKATILKRSKDMCDG